MLPKITTNTIWQRASVTQLRREQITTHKLVALWLTGLSGSAKSTQAHALEEQLHQNDLNTFVLDVDNVRRSLCSDLGFSNARGNGNVHLISETGKLLLEAGIVALSTFIYLSKAERILKSLYKEARQGEIKDFTGISSRCGEPENPKLRLDTSQLTLE